MPIENLFFNDIFFTFAKIKDYYRHRNFRFSNCKCVPHITFDGAQFAVNQHIAQPSKPRGCAHVQKAKRGTLMDNRDVN